ncbi:MAG TPA: arsenate reductase (glutaredoxin) [Fredinandcohnia sp.]|nr:arsenate reductase (glutaredoxin) [Fredinandcohnia sp.]
MNRIYHNPKCSTSRKALALLEERGVQVEVIEYLKHPPSREELVDLLKQMRMTPRELLRKKGEVYEQLDLANPKWTDDQILDFMVEHPVLIERPIVVTKKGARLGRPVERILEIL